MLKKLNLKGIKKKRDVEFEISEPTKRKPKEVLQIVYRKHFCNGAVIKIDMDDIFSYEVVDNFLIVVTKEPMMTYASIPLNWLSSFCVIRFPGD